MATTESYRFVQEHPESVHRAQEQMQSMLARSATDFDFRQTLLTDPRAAIAEFTGKDISEVPESINLVFIENTADATIVLPDVIDNEAELSIEELEAVAGGGEILFAGVALITAILVVADHVQDHEDNN